MVGDVEQEQQFNTQQFAGLNQTNNHQLRNDPPPSPMMNSLNKENSNENHKVQSHYLLDDNDDEHHSPLQPASAKCRSCCRKFFAFLLSNVGLCVLVVAYSICGAFMFRAIESPYEVQTAKQVNDLRNNTISKLWNITRDINIDLYPDKWKLNVTTEIKLFQIELLKAIKDGYEGHQSAGREQWSFSGAFLFSLTVISTIGYGNLSPRTVPGKLLTMLYAIVGIPVMLLYLTNIGDMLAKSFRYVYGGACFCRQGKSQRRKMLKRTLSSVSASMNANQTLKNAMMPDGSDLLDFDQILKLKEESDRVHVPITLCLLILASYVCCGGVLFSLWEGWEFLDGSYFCFVTLSTIGFGDLVPGASVVDSSGSQEKLVICSLYLLGGMALLAMCFNLMQEEVKHKLKQFVMKLGIFPPSTSNRTNDRKKKRNS